MTNYEVIHTMTVKELANLILFIERTTTWGDIWESWLRAESQQAGGLLTEEMKKYWKVH